MLLVLNLRRRFQTGIKRGLSNMQLGLDYSLKIFIENVLDIETFIHRDGLKLPIEGNFSVVKRSPNLYSQISKAREAMSSVYRYEINIYAETLADRETFQDALVESFMFTELELYDNQGNST